MMTPATKQLIATLDCYWHEFWIERASIIEFDSKLPREEAEQQAWMETSKAILSAKIKKMADHQAKQPQYFHIHKKTDTAILAVGSE